MDILLLIITILICLFLGGCLIEFCLNHWTSIKMKGANFVTRTFNFLKRNNYQIQYLCDINCITFLVFVGFTQWVE